MPGPAGQEGQDDLEQVVALQDVRVEGRHPLEESLQHPLLAQLTSRENLQVPGRISQCQGQDRVPIGLAVLQPIGNLGCQVNLHPSQVAQSHAPEEGPPRREQVLVNRIGKEDLGRVGVSGAEAPECGDVPTQGAQVGHGGNADQVAELALPLQADNFGLARVPSQQARVGKPEEGLERLLADRDAFAFPPPGGQGPLLHVVRRHQARGPIDPEEGRMLGEGKSVQGEWSVHGLASLPKRALVPCREGPEGQTSSASSASTSRADAQRRSGSFSSRRARSRLARQGTMTSTGRAGTGASRC